MTQAPEPHPNARLTLKLQSKASETKYPLVLPILYREAKAFFEHLDKSDPDSQTPLLEWAGELQDVTKGAASRLLEISRRAEMRPFVQYLPSSFQFFRTLLVTFAEADWLVRWSIGWEDPEGADKPKNPYELTERLESLDRVTGRLNDLKHLVLDYDNLELQVCHMRTLTELLENIEQVGGQVDTRNGKFRVRVPEDEDKMSEFFQFLETVQRE